MLRCPSPLHFIQATRVSLSAKNQFGKLVVLYLSLINVELCGSVAFDLFSDFLNSQEWLCITKIYIKLTNS
jgi:hypothetical protein